MYLNQVRRDFSCEFVWLFQAGQVPENLSLPGDCNPGVQSSIIQQMAYCWWPSEDRPDIGDFAFGRRKPSSFCQRIQNQICFCRADIGNVPVISGRLMSKYGFEYLVAQFRLRSADAVGEVVVIRSFSGKMVGDIIPRQHKALRHFCGCRLEVGLPEECLVCALIEARTSF